MMSLTGIAQATALSVAEFMDVEVSEELQTKLHYKCRILTNEFSYISEQIVL